MEMSGCKADLEPRYRRLFDDVSIHSGDSLCEQSRAMFQSRYSGEVNCVHGRRD